MIALDIDGLRSAYRSKRLLPRMMVADLISQLDAAPDRAIWITRISDTALHARAAALEDLDCAELPLYGIPFAVKDNIDVAGLNWLISKPLALFGKCLLSLWS